MLPLGRLLSGNLLGVPYRLLGLPYICCGCVTFASVTKVTVK